MAVCFLRSHSLDCFRIERRPKTEEGVKNDEIEYFKVRTTINVSDE